MNPTARALSSAAVVLALVLLASFQAAAGEPTEQIRSAISRGVEILDGTNLNNEKQRKTAVDRLREIVYPLFDFKEMAMRALGPHWRRLEAQQQKDFVALFTELLERTYAERIDLYEGQKVVYTGETLDKNYAVVKTKIVGKNGESYSADYRLHLAEGKWRIYDVVAENISLVNNYRSQFNRIIVNSSFDELLKKMKEKTT
jgi:phospholipid transport system substrate-binding protein